MPENTFGDFLLFLEELERRKIAYDLDHVRPDTLMVQVYVPGQRWEVEFYADGRIEIEVFQSSSGVTGVTYEGLLKRLEPYSD